MEPDYRVVPWYSTNEWENVKECLLTGKLIQAKKIITVWNTRTFKLDAGKYRKLCTLE